MPYEGETRSQSHLRYPLKVQNPLRGIFRKGKISLEVCTVDEIELKKDGKGELWLTLLTLT